MKMQIISRKFYKTDGGNYIDNSRSWFSRDVPDCFGGNNKCVTVWSVSVVRVTSRSRPDDQSASVWGAQLTDCHPGRLMDDANGVTGRHPVSAPVERVAADGDTARAPYQTPSTPS